MSEGVILDDYEKSGLVGIDIDKASKKISVQMLTLVKLPNEVKKFSA